MRRGAIVRARCGGPRMMVMCDMKVMMPHAPGVRRLKVCWYNVVTGTFTTDEFGEDVLVPDEVAHPYREVG